jgi:hypothetical protein
MLTPVQTGQAMTGVVCGLVDSFSLQARLILIAMTPRTVIFPLRR